jgi:hypothetical protein
MNHRKNIKSCESLNKALTLNRPITYFSPLDNSFVTISEKSIEPKRKVSFNPNINVVEIENTKHLNLQNSISRSKIFENLVSEKKRKIQEKNDNEEEIKKEESCIGCFIF